MEELLNKLIENGWKPRWLERIKWGIIYCWPRWWITFQHKGRVFDFWRADYVLYNWKEYLDYDSYITHLADSVIVDTKHIFEYRKSLRTLCSKESWLWQFCEKNWMIDWHKYDSKTYEVRIENWIKRREVWPEWEVSTKEIWRPRHSAEYRLIESALCDEDKLEEFLLQNIKVEW